jgi:hypothetical protein
MRRLLLVTFAVLCASLSQAGQFYWNYLSKVEYDTSSGGGAFLSSAAATNYQANADSTKTMNKPFGIPTMGGSQIGEGYDVLHFRVVWDQDSVFDYPPNVEVEMRANISLDGDAELTGTPPTGFSVVGTEATVTVLFLTVGLTSTLSPQPPLTWWDSKSSAPSGTVTVSPDWVDDGYIAFGLKRYVAEITIQMPTLRASSSMYFTGYQAVGGTSNAMSKLDVDFKLRAV